MDQDTGHGQAGAAPPIIDEAGRQFRAPWAASVAGLLFAGLFTVTLVLLRNQSLIAATDSELVEILATGQDLPAWVAVVSLFILRRERSRQSA